MDAAHSYRELLTHLLARRDLAAAQMAAAMRGILEGAWTPAQTAGFLVALKIKGETPAEIAAAAAVMRAMAVPVPLDDDSAVDTCGTGGDGAGLFNISTAAAFVAAGAGARVAKHGNRALSGVSGSADVLSELGVTLNLTPQKIAAMIRDTGIGFMFAPNHHPAVRHAAPVRKELGVRTVFNLLGPMCNPAGVRRQVVGVYDLALLAPYAETLGAAGALRALVVYGGGLDEITIAGETDIAELKDGAVLRRTLSPEDAGLAAAPLDSLRVSSAAESAALIRRVLAGETGAARDIVLLNAAAALIVAEIADDFADGVRRAAAAIDSGAAQKKLETAAAISD
ncbi:MAG: anthranilate phosphoribosyltransferase [Betaproteobacteria bacterium]|nr:anthranilate phosphoribosyltransferase [Betaproteobacteria bacterium]